MKKKDAEIEYLLKVLNDQFEAIELEEKHFSVIEARYRNDLRKVGNTLEAKSEQKNHIKILIKNLEWYHTNYAI